MPGQARAGQVGVFLGWWVGVFGRFVGWLVEGWVGLVGPGQARAGQGRPGQAWPGRGRFTTEKKKFTTEKKQVYYRNRSDSAGKNKYFSKWGSPKGFSLQTIDFFFCRKFFVDTYRLIVPLFDTFAKKWPILEKSGLRTREVFFLKNRPLRIDKNRGQRGDVQNIRHTPTLELPHFCRKCLGAIFSTPSDSKRIF